jgi:hypothetical protein
VILEEVSPYSAHNVKMKDQFYFNHYFSWPQKSVISVPVDSAVSLHDEKQIILYLSSSVPDSVKGYFFSYMNAGFYPWPGNFFLFAAYMGPWLRNPRGICVPAFSVPWNEDSLFTGTDKPSMSIAKRSLSLLTSPNPFYSSINISVTGLSKGADLRIYDINGRLVANLSSGLLTNSSGTDTYRISWIASNLSSGVYIVLLKSGWMELKYKVLLIR